MSIHHKNLTGLVGYCNEDNHLGIIYEYMGNGVLEGHLAGTFTLVFSLIYPPYNSRTLSSGTWTYKNPKKQSRSDEIV